MKLTTAIEIHTKTLKANYKFLDPDFRDSLKIGIEAMKRVEENRGCALLFVNQLLPGETKEN